MPFAEGETVGPYRITAHLGQGGMATVFRAYHPNLDRYVAIKVLHTSFKDDPSFLARFQREAQIVAKLEHPNIVPIYDYSEHNGEPYLVMKFIEGETLKALLQRQPLTLEQALSTMTAVGQALTYAHERDVLHRDVKPSNILVDKSGTPYLADFGLARMATAGESTLSQDMMLGTPQYISPEQAQGIQNLDGKTDIYSLGVVLYELVVGRVPFNADTPYAIVHDHIYSPLPLPTKVNPQVPPAVERVLLKALAKDPADRYSTAVEMVEGFRQAVRESDMKELTAGKYRVPVGAAPFGTGDSSASKPAGPSIPSPVPTIPGTSTQQTPQPRRSNSWLVLGVGAVVLVGIAALVLALSSNGNASKVLPTVAQLGSGAEAAVLPTTTVTMTVTATTKPTLKPIVIATEDASLQTATDDGTAATNDNVASDQTGKGTDIVGLPTPLADVRQFPDVNSIEAQRQVTLHPNDPHPHFILAVSLIHEGKIAQEPRAVQEFQTGMNQTANNPSLALQIAEEMAATPNVGALPAFEYAVAYQASGNNHPTIQAQSGRYLYGFAKNASTYEKATLDRWNQYVLSTSSAGLYAFAALEAHTLGQDDAATTAINKAISLDFNSPEVHLVHGILEAAQNDSADAKKDFNSAIKAQGAPDWAVSEAKFLVGKG